MNAIEKTVLNFVAQPAWLLLSEAIFLVVVTARGILPAEVGGVLGSLIMNGWILAGCYFLERKFDANLKMPFYIYIVSFLYMSVVPVFSFGDGGLPSFISYLYGALLSFFVIYYAHFIAKIGKNELSIIAVILRSALFTFLIAFYPIGIWFIQPKIIGFLKGVMPYKN